MPVTRTFPGLLTALGLLISSAAAQPPPAQVDVAPVEQRAITLASRLVGEVEPMVVSTLAAETSALLRSRDFDEGVEIEAGHVLARLDDSLLLVRLQSAQAVLRSAEAELLRARLVEEHAELERRRASGLYERGVATEREHLDAVSAYDQAVAGRAVAEARLAERRAEIELLELQIEKHRVVAPVTGVVNRRYVEVGQWVQQGDAVAQVVQLDPLFVRTGVPEGVVARLRTGQRAEVSLAALGETMQGTVEQILPMADPESRTFVVRLRVDNERRVLRPGMFARVTFRSAEEGMLVVPKDAIVNVEGRTHVVAVREGAAALIPVELGAAEGVLQAVLPLDGELSPGEQVVVRGNEALAPGQRLTIRNQLEASAGG